MAILSNEKFENSIKANVVSFNSNFGSAIVSDFKIRKVVSEFPYILSDIHEQIGESSEDEMDFL